MSDEAGTSSATQFARLYVELIRIRNFRGLRECELELEPDVTLLVGRNNSGKSRVLRALAVALGSTPADFDDLSVGLETDATIDLVISPPPPTGPDDEQSFEDNIAQLLRNTQTISDDPFRERFAWRTTIRRSTDGFGARAEMNPLIYDLNSGDWELPSQNASSLDKRQRQLLSADLVGPNRDLVRELTRRESAVRRVISDLELDETTRHALQARLDELNSELSQNSPTLQALSSALGELDATIGLGTPYLSPLPTNLEEVSRAISFGLDTGSGPIPIRLHGSGVRSLASLQVQGVLYDRRLGADGPNTRPHPLTLVEEPEAHLHPQACFELPELLRRLAGQVVVTTHSAHLVSEMPERSIRLLRRNDTTGASTIIDLGPSASNAPDVPRSLRAATYVEEMEKLKRLVERPFGELVFSNLLVLGDGATERAFLPIVLRHALGAQAHGICVLDPQSINGTLSRAAVKFANLVKIPWVLFCDTDEQGEQGSNALIRDFGGGDRSKLVNITGNVGGAGPVSAIESMLIGFDEELCKAACLEVRPDLDRDSTAIDMMTKLKGSVGSAVALGLVAKYPTVNEWPEPLQELVTRLKRLTEPVEAEMEERTEA